MRARYLHIGNTYFSYLIASPYRETV